MRTFLNGCLSLSVSLSILLSVSLSVLGCGDELSPRADVQVLLAIASVPADVSCVRISVASPGRTVVREVGVSPGAAVSESFGGLPLGTVQFKGEAFPSGCEEVTKSTVAAWVSESVPVSIVLGRLSTVALTLHRNGRAKVSVDFADEPACSAAAQVCLNDSECCSRSCTRGVCGADDGGAGDAGN